MPDAGDITQTMEGLYRQIGVYVRSDALDLLDLYVHPHPPTLASV